MEKKELLEKFNTQLDAYAQVRGFIEKAKSQGSKFRPEVIEKVCLTHEVKSMELAETVLPLVADMEAHINGLQGTVTEVEGTKGGSGEALEEMELRLAIGELSEKDFEKEAKSLKEELEKADGKIAGAQEELDAFRLGLEKWINLATEAGHATGATDSPIVEEEIADVVAEEAPLELEASAFGDDDGEPIDLASGFGDGEVEVAEAEVEIDEPEIEEALAEEALAEEAPADEAPSDEMAIEVSPDNDSQEDSVVPGVGEEDFLAGEEPVVEAAIEEVDGETASVNGADDRRALLLYQEGTAEEQIYPFTNDEISIGRGRDNEIQIKNDSKVSRKHCILFRENDAFFIKDNKSSNGSLVNGELITERRLFGGEEIIIGETFFRFRIMD